ncbi:hypothetical protein [Oceanisphaera sp. W20_SRM_FM3]|uniref:hypothetical protein n=1 Tax=Oceanisphaera sp. W20_SRM_FM3 TaxID=3240267 RepID=UPI003F9C67B7
MKKRTLSRQGGLALLLAVLVVSLCMSQRMGLKIACTLDHAALHSEQLNASNVSPHNTKAEPEKDSCSLSEQLLSKVFQHLDPLFIAIILLFALWLAPVQASRYRRRRLAPLLFPGRRRHLVLCVFRE